MDGLREANQVLTGELKLSRARVAELELELEQRQEFAQELAAEKQRLAVTLTSIGDGVITTDVEGKVVLVNPVAEKLTGWTQVEAAGKMLVEIFHIISERTGKEVDNPVKKVLETGMVRGLANHTILIAREGTARSIADSAAPIRDTVSGEVAGVVLVFRDVSEQQQLEEELHKAQKLESVGILAGGIAHDFNNILMMIAGNLWLSKMTLSEANNEIWTLLTEAEAAVFRAKDLTQQLLTFAQGGSPVKKVASLKTLLEESVKFALRGSNVRPVFNFPKGLWLSEIDTGQINQVINNLVINADQAMPEGGILTVSAENVPFMERVLHDPLSVSVPIKEIDYVKIIIQDEGVGIPTKALPKIFDPYFTTKQKGGGLGLATVYSIITRHDGFITATSQAGRGTSFFIYLPAAHNTEEAEEATEKVLEKGSGGKLLIVDDEQQILDVLYKSLTAVGYEVVLSADGADAIEFYWQAMQADQPFEIVILDLTIPGGMGGKETMARLLEINPAVKAIVASGYSNDPVMAQYPAYGFKAALSKPFKFNELRRTIEEVLED